MAARPVVYKINIGEGVLIAPNVTISTTNHPMHYMVRQYGEMYCKKVVIEDHVWIGSNVVICAGVTVGKICYWRRKRCYQRYSSNEFCGRSSLQSDPGDYR